MGSKLIHKRVIRQAVNAPYEYQACKPMSEAFNKNECYGPAYETFKANSKCLWFDVTCPTCLLVKKARHRLDAIKKLNSRGLGL